MLCDGAASAGRDRRQDLWTLAVIAEHVGVKASAGQTGAAVADGHAARGVAERAGSKVTGSEVTGQLQ